MNKTPQLLEPLRKFVQEVSAAKGEFCLVGFFLREEAAQWDFVLSARWLEEEGMLNGLKDFSPRLIELVGKQGRTMFHIVTVDPDDPRLSALIQEYPVENGLVELRDVELFDMEMKRAFILQAKLPLAKVTKSAKAGKSSSKSSSKTRAAKGAAGKAMHASRAR